MSTFSARSLPIPNHLHGLFVSKIQNSNKYLIQYESEDSQAHLMVMYPPKNTHTHTHNHSYILTIEPRMVDILWACSPILFEHMMVFIFFIFFLNVHC